jgi:hypothetical protein
VCLSLDNGVTASLSILYCLADKHQTSEEAGQELGSGDWEQELGFDPANSFLGWLNSGNYLLTKMRGGGGEETREGRRESGGESKTVRTREGGEGDLGRE